MLLLTGMSLVKNRIINNIVNRYTSLFSQQLSKAIHIRDEAWSKARYSSTSGDCLTFRQQRTSASLGRMNLNIISQLFFACGGSAEFWSTISSLKSSLSPCGQTCHLKSKKYLVKLLINHPSLKFLITTFNHQSCSFMCVCVWGGGTPQ